MAFSYRAATATGMKAYKMNEWMNPGAITGMLGFITSLAGLAYTRKVEIRQAKSDQPTVSIDLIATTWDGWYRVILTVRNRTDAVWVIEEISTPHWDSARMGLQEIVLNARANGDIGPPPREAAQFDPVGLGNRIDPAGSSGAGEWRGHLLLSVERGLSQSITFRLSLRSLAEIRPMIIHVQRTATD